MLNGEDEMNMCSMIYHLKMSIGSGGKCYICYIKDNLNLYGKETGAIRG